MTGHKLRSLPVRSMQWPAKTFPWKERCVLYGKIGRLVTITRTLLDTVTGHGCIALALATAAALSKSAKYEGKVSRRLTNAVLECVINGEQNFESNGAN